VFGVQVPTPRPCVLSFTVPSAPEVLLIAMTTWRRWPPAA
jgi:hypothetical protein